VKNHPIYLTARYQTALLLTAVFGQMQWNCCLSPFRVVRSSLGYDMSSVTRVLWLNGTSQGIGGGTVG